MRLLRLRVHQLRQFRQALEIGDFAPGLNLFVGPNESGKSTLVRAIRAAFFERHRSSSVDDLQPWGDSAAAPEVQLDFEHDGRTWCLSKRFLQQRRCDLTVDGQQYAGEEAEEMLAELLGFQFAGRGASKAEHWGIPGLMWIEQGQAQDVKVAIRHAGEHLKSALGASLGEVASSAGDDVIDAVQALRGRLLTSRANKPTGAYAEALARREHLDAALAELDGRIAHYQSQVDRLEELRHLQAAEAAQRPWLALREQERQARQKFAEIEKLKEQQARDSRELDDCVANNALVSEQLERFHKQAESLTAREKALSAAYEKLQTLLGRQDAVDEAAAKARARYEQALEQERDARGQAQRLRVQGDIAQIQDAMQRLENDLERARALHAEMLALRAEAEATAIDAAALKRLKRLTEELNTLRIRQSAMATKLRYELRPDAPVTLNGQRLTGGDECLLLEPAELDIAGVGKIRVIPGGEDIGELVRKLRLTAQAVDTLMRELQVESLAAAETRAERHAHLRATLNSHQQLLKSHAPEGVEALQDALRGRQRQLAQRQEELAGMPEAQASVSVEQAAAQREVADAELKAAEQAATQLRQQLAAATQRHETAREEFDNLRNELEDPKRQEQVQAWSRRLVDLDARARVLRTTLDERRQVIESSRPDILEQDIKRFSDSATQAEQAFQRREGELARLESELAALGASGLEEERARLAGELEALARRCAELKRRADAASLLLDLLRDKRQALTRRLQAPLQNHINHYLRLLFPQASLDLDEDLLPVQLIRPQGHGLEAGAFDALSFGAREQMGLISRLAYADLLKAAGKPTLIILDDALVHSDRERLAQMKRVLFDAGQRHQILLFSCHPENWRDLGVPQRQLTTAVAGGAAEALETAEGSVVE